MIHFLNADQQAMLARQLASQDGSRSQGMTLSRRNFLRSSGGAGLALAFAWLPVERASAASPLDSTAAPVSAPLTPNAFVRVGPDNLVTIVCKHLEMGQGNTTGLATLVADELDADPHVGQTFQY